LEKTEDAGRSQELSFVGGIAVAEGKVTREGLMCRPTNRWTGARGACFAT